MDDFQLKETFKRLIKEFHERGLPQLVERELETPDFKKIRKIFVIVGPRRAGKTYLAYQIMEKRMRKGKKITDFLYINFEDERILGLKAEKLTALLEAYMELYPENKPEVYLDEVQNVTGWESFARRLSDSGHEIHVTGSNSRLLSKEIATTLRGRCVTLELLPFSFNEFIKSKNVDLKPNWPYGSQKNEVVKLFQSYLELSGYPEVVLENRLELIEDYYKTVFYQDVVERYKIKNTELMRLLMRYLYGHYAQSFTVNRFNQFAKSNGYTSSTSVIHRYVQILQDAYYCYFVHAQTKSVKKETTYHKKTYMADHGFINHFVTEKDKGRLLENLVFLELVRRGTRPKYWTNANGCDFVTNDSAIQVTYALDENNRKREIDGAIHAAHRLNLQNALIITQDQEDQMTVENVTLRIIPAWKWLLEKPNT